VVVGFYFIFLVYRENTFTAATIEVAAGQKVIATGPYAVVRHPMYASGSVYMLSARTGAFSRSPRSRCSGSLF
jgi:protein-S-isoprenylcysteine O-methyltransferase Ste14